MSDKSKNVNVSAKSEVTPVLNADYTPSAGDKILLSITGVLTEKKRGEVEGAGHIRGTLYNDECLIISEDGKKLILNTTTESTPLTKRFATISSIRVSRGTLTLASAKHADGKYDLTCFDATESRADGKHAYKEGTKWASVRASANYEVQTNAQAVITQLRQAIAKHYGLSGGSSGSKLDAAAQKAVINDLQTQLEKIASENASLLARLLAFEAQASKKEASPIK